jgi:methionyl-tRNA formyltransferase
MLATFPQGRAQQIIFFGTPEVAVGPMRALFDTGIPIGLVVTGQDKRRGRGSELSASPVKRAAVELGLRISHDISDAVMFASNNIGCLGVVVAFGHLFGADVISQIPLVNIHYSLLPRWRGAAPVERTMLSGDVAAGVSIMRIVEELDAGDIFAQDSLQLNDTESLGELRLKLEQLAQPLLVSGCLNGFGEATAQQGEVSFAKKITTDDLRIDFSKSAVFVSRQIRVGGAFCLFRGRRMKILDAHVVDNKGLVPSQIQVVGSEIFVGCAVGSLQLLTVQMEGKPLTPAASWSNGARPQVGECFDV